MGGYYHENTIVFLDGAYVKAADARIDLYSQTMHYGYGVFEGIRSYTDSDGGTSIFKATEHFERLQYSAKALNIPFHYSVEELTLATYQVLSQNNLQDAYIRPLIFLPANMSFNPTPTSHLMIAAWEMQPFLGDKLVRLMTSSFQRPNPKGFKIGAKACGHYVNSIMASHEAKANGYDEAMLLDMNGYAAEGPGANLFIEVDGVLFTPPAGNILPGITRHTILSLCETHGIPVAEKLFTPEEMKKADSAFYCGTAAEIIGIASLDDYIFPQEWATTQGALLQKAYKELVALPAGFSILTSN
jgi:branched-chain amino acid aminotransferase